MPEFGVVFSGIGNLLSNVRPRRGSPGGQTDDPVGRIITNLFFLAVPISGPEKQLSAVFVITGLVYQLMLLVRPIPRCIHCSRQFSEARDSPGGCVVVITIRGGGVPQRVSPFLSL